jgi:hypothetical protein
VSPIDVVLDRLASHRVRPNGTDRWRACCPGHAGSNPSALSIGVGAEGQVLLRCWSGCEVDQVIGALGLELGDLFPPRESSAGKPARRRLITASQALDLLDAEMTFAVVCASDLSHGQALDDATRDRLLLAAARVTMLRTEARA